MVGRGRIRRKVKRGQEKQNIRGKRERLVKTGRRTTGNKGIKIRA